jgi:polar amino acid transport system substrate-binding protein
MSPAKQNGPVKRDGVGRREVFGLSAAGATGAVVAASALAAPFVREARAQGRPESRLYEVLDRGVVRVGTGSTNPPWHFEDDQGNLVGMDVDMGKLLAKGLFEDDTKIEFVRQSSDARIPNLVTDKADIAIQFMTITAGRAQQVEFTVPYYREGVGLLLLEGGAHESFDDLKAKGAGVTVSVLQNVYAEDIVHAALPEAAVLQLDSQANVVQAIAAGRADAAAIDQSTVSWLVVQQRGQYKDSGYGWYPQSYGAAVRPGDPVWLNFVNTVFKEAMAGVEFPSYAASFKKWFGVDLASPPLGFPVEFA